MISTFTHTEPFTTSRYFGHLAYLNYGFKQPLLPVKVFGDQFMIGCLWPEEEMVSDGNWAPSDPLTVTFESVEKFSTRREARLALETGNWTQRRQPTRPEIWALVVLHDFECQWYELRVFLSDRYMALRNWFGS